MKNDEVERDDVEHLEALMARFLNGERRALMYLFEALRRPVFSYLVRLSQNPTLAEDLLQETFIAVHIRGGTFQTGKKVLPWIMAIARNKFFEWHRREGKVVRLLALNERRETTSHPDHAVTVDVRRELEAALETLSPINRETFYLKHVMGFKFHEIAELHGVPLPTVKSRMLFSLKKLREILENEI
jgi:RNA polymerase sigma-70 factor (ECF subfamily)